MESEGNVQVQAGDTATGIAIGMKTEGKASASRIYSSRYLDEKLKKD